MNIFITGCSQGLGYELWQLFKAKGHFVLPHFRKDVYKLKTPKVIGDLNNYSIIEKIEKAIEKYKIDTYIANAGIYYTNDFFNTPHEIIKDIFNTNLITQTTILQLIYEHFIKLNSLCKIGIINSIAIKSINSKEHLYRASKIALDSISKSLQIEIAQDNRSIKITDFYIGAMKTRMTVNRSNYNQLIQPTEVANIIYNSLVHSNTSYINEVTIRKL